MKKILILALGILFLGGCLDLSFASSKVVLRKELVKERVIIPVPSPVSILAPVASMTTQCIGDNVKEKMGVTLLIIMAIPIMYYFRRFANGKIA